MILFWFLLAVIFFIVEIFTLTFGFIFITFGAVIITFLLGIDVISNSDILYQVLIMLFFGIISFIFFYRSFKKSVENREKGFKEDMTAMVIDSNLVKGKEGKVKWSGTISNALLDNNASVDEVAVGSLVNIKEFRGNVAIVDNNIKNN